ncbi:very long-chain acyl-CoA synthetase-like [Chanos chanos]|uniref:long-chain-fatty-acid--CoA ligase n=1 Tax=Chanos chanos TaxID=29144 RepID=A0A6J2X0D0_CHACN|nr:very long-chain acyl-CoA synthetase-like [Chanos chanos]
METLVTVLLGVSLILAFIHFKFPCLWHDFQYLRKFAAVRLQRLKFRQKKPFYTILDCFLDRVRKHPEKPFIIFGNKSYSYLDVDRQSNKVANALRTHSSLTEGDTVTLFLGNEPCFAWIWLGLCKLGCAASVLNINIRAQSLLHCFFCCDSSVLIAAAELEEAVKEVLPQLLERNVTVFLLKSQSGTEGLRSLSEKIDRASDEPLSPDLRSRVTMDSPGLFIFTSGTTGLPKASIFSQDKVWAGALFLCLAGVTSQDVIYIPLPLYHGSGLLLGLSGAIERGITVVLKRKFSVSQFWDDCRRDHVTVIIYIGEIMRYLCNTPKRDNDREHRVRIAVGNGIRADVWRSVLERFGDIKIVEFYGASDGNISFINYVGKIGAIGRVHYFHKMVLPYTLIKFDTIREEPVRDSNGRCIEVWKGETGLLVSKITKMAPFAGYAGNLEHTEKKKLRDVFQKGDLYFNSGDLLMIDHDNFIYFQDRVGDTFRWKGENVATTEVSDILKKMEFVEDVNVYGVKVPGYEGRVGMAAVTLRERREFNCTEAFTHVSSYLPAYARPRFIRIQTCLEITGTFKYIKTKLEKDGFNPAMIHDPLFVLEEKNNSYTPMTQMHYDSIISGKIRL